MTPQQAAEKIYMLKQAIKAMEDEVDTLQAEHFTSRAVDTYVEGKFKVVVGRNARFDPALAKEILSPGDYQRILSTKPDSGKAKDVLAPEVYRSLQKVSTNKVTVTLPKEDD